MRLQKGYEVGPLSFMTFLYDKCPAFNDVEHLNELFLWGLDAFANKTCRP